VLYWCRYSRVQLRRCWVSGRPRVQNSSS